MKLIAEKKDIKTLKSYISFSHQGVNLVAANSKILINF
jgi:hypothetical protein